MSVSPAADGFHPVGPGRWWEESWHFSWRQGFARQSYFPHLGVIWFWCYIFLDGEIVFVRDHGVPLGARWGRSEHRATGLWFDVRPQEPLRAWSLQLEAVGLGSEEMPEGTEEAGLPTPVGLDVSFEAVAEPYAWATGDGFGQLGQWSGEVLIGSRTLPLEGPGAREHRWGERDWSAPWRAFSWHDGVTRGAQSSGAEAYLWEDGGIRPLDGGAVAVEAEILVGIPTGRGLLRRGPARLTVSGVPGEGEVEYNVPVRVENVP